MYGQFNTLTKNPFFQNSYTKKQIYEHFFLKKQKQNSNQIKRTAKFLNETEKGFSSYNVNTCTFSALGLFKYVDGIIRNIEDQSGSMHGSISNTSSIVTT